MIDKFLNRKIMQWLSLLPAINFNIAVIFLLAVSLVSVSGSSLFFENNSELYGPLASNLRLMLIYLTLSQFSAYCFCSYIENYRLLMAVGLFWLMLMASINFYGTVNQIPIDEDYNWLFLYLGLSNLVYGGFMVLNRETV
jgi:hypothetical protein